MKIDKLKIITGLLLLVLFITSSCNKLIDVGLPADSLDKDKVFSDEGTAMSALNGLYLQLMTSGMAFGNSQVSITAGLSSDELSLATANAVYSEFLSNNLSVSNTSVASLWSNPYSRIYQCNAIIENTKNSTSLSNDLKNRLIGESEFMRGFFYFYLVQMFGDVPLVVSTDYTETASVSRTSMDSVYKQIIVDLKDASLLLTTDLSTGKTRPSKWSAEALLSRVYLYTNDWTNAALLSNDVMESNQYQILTDPTKVFLANSNEAILQFAPVDGNGYTWEGFYFIPKSTAAPSYPLTDTLLHSFENGDARKLNWIGSKTVNGKSYNYSYKYKVGSGVGTPTEYYMVLRYAEQVLIHAEALAHTNDLQNALKDVDKLRLRAGLPLYSNDGITRNQSDVLLLIEKERQHELFCEWGHRWFDLNRTSRTAAVLNPIKPGFKSTATLFPVPYTQIQRNYRLTQNLGYQN